MEASHERLFVDTGYLIARFNVRDQYHTRARELDDVVLWCRELWTTDAVLLEFAAACSEPARRIHAVTTWDQFHDGDKSYESAEVYGDLMSNAMQLYRSRMDKSWSLADCLSFEVMAQHEIAAALTPDYHFVQAGYRALMLE